MTKTEKQPTKQPMATMTSEVSTTEVTAAVKMKSKKSGLKSRKRVLFPAILFNRRVGLILAKGAGIAILISLPFLILSSMIEQYLANVYPSSVVTALVFPDVLVSEGAYSLSITAWISSAMLLFAAFGVLHGGVYRFLGYHALGILAAFVFAALTTTVLYANLFGNLSGYPPNLTTFFIALLKYQHNNPFEFFLAAIIGFGGTLSMYGWYLYKLFFSGSQPLGNARLAHGFDCFRARLFSPQGKGFVLGNSHYGKLRYAGFEPIIVVSGTGGGKTKSVVIPNVFELKNENMVITDIKGEIYQTTHLFRRACGNKVFRFEPASENTHRYNPFGMVRLTHIDEDLDVIFRALIPDSHDPFWADASRNAAKMIAMMLFVLEKTTPTLQGIYQELCNPALASQIRKKHDKLPQGQIKNLFGKFISLEEKLRSEILISAQEYLSKFDSPKLAYATSANDFDFRKLRKEPTTIYLILPANTATFGSIAAIFFEQLITLATETEPKAGDYSINALIDEFANLPKMNSLAKGVSFLRSYRVRVCAFVQNVAQLKAVYGNELKDGLMSAPIKLAFTIGSYEDAEYFSKLAGKKTMKVNNESIQQDLSMSVASQRQLRDVLSPHEVMRLDDKYLLIFRTGFHAVKAKKNFWMKNKNYVHAHNRCAKFAHLIMGKSAVSKQTQTATATPSPAVKQSKATANNTIRSDAAC